MSFRRSSGRPRPNFDDAESDGEGELDREQSYSWAHTSDEPKGLFRSFSDRRKQRRTLSVSTQSINGEEGETEGESESEGEGGLRRSWSLRSRKRGSFRKSKSTPDAITVLEQPSAPSSSARKAAGDNQRLSFPISPPSATDTSHDESLGSGSKSKKKDSESGGFKARLRNTIRRPKKGKKDSASDESQGTNSSTATKPQGDVVKADYFKSKKGKHWWASRFGTEEIILTTVAFDDLLPSERQTFTSYAVEQLTITLRRPVTAPRDICEEEQPTVANTKRPSGIGSLIKKITRSSFAAEPVASPLAPPSPAQSGSPGRPRSSESQYGQVFGVPLQQLLDEDRIRTDNPTLKLPIIVSTCIEFLAEHGLDVNGIFRISGSSRRIRQLNESFDSGVEADLSKASPNDVAAVLKYFLRSLPQPLLTTQLYPSFIQVIHLASADEQLAMLRMLCGLLPDCNRHLLQALLALLSKIAEYADEPEGNLMHSRNLALVLAPNILKAAESRTYKRTSSSSRSLQQRQAGLGEDTAEANMVSAEGDACDVVELMIDYQEHLFVVPPEMRDSILLHYQLTDPPMVTQVLKELIEHKQKQIQQSRKAEVDRSLAEGARHLPPNFAPLGKTLSAPDVLLPRKSPASSRKSIESHNGSPQLQEEQQQQQSDYNDSAPRSNRAVSLPEQTLSQAVSGQATNGGVSPRGGRRIDMLPVLTEESRQNSQANLGHHQQLQRKLLEQQRHQALRPQDAQRQQPRQYLQQEEDEDMILGSRSPSPDASAWTPSPPPRHITSSVVRPSLTHIAAAGPPPIVLNPPTSSGSQTSLSNAPQELHRPPRHRYDATATAAAGSSASLLQQTGAETLAPTSNALGSSFLEAMALSLLMDKDDFGVGDGNDDDEDGELRRTDSQLAAEMQQLWDRSFGSKDSSSNNLRPKKLSEASSPPLSRTSSFRTAAATDSGSATARGGKIAMVVPPPPTTDPYPGHSTAAAAGVGAGSVTFDAYRKTAVMILDASLDEEGTFV